ncbi:hypothetical protein ACF3NA_06190 [Alkanindiges sp. WGS2144]|uniref:hypothetical protein n=1 Tax=Alkanindiges sp. WGS2144 TaxID=3366808 RepID=UPI00375347D2
MDIIPTSFKVLVLSFAILGSNSSLAETIYTWEDEREALTNYGDIPPDDELGADAVKIVNLQQGLTTKVDFPTRAVDEAIEKSRQLSLISPSAGPASQNPSATNAPKMIGSSAPASTGATLPPQPLANDQPRMLGSGSSNTANDSAEAQKLNEQEAKLEAQAQSARRIAMDKRKEEMRALAERVRNGAASRQEIAALMTYRQTASFGEARGALARPKVSTKSQ